jgi:hypothetical protein
MKVLYLRGSVLRLLECLRSTVEVFFLSII